MSLLLLGTTTCLLCPRKIDRRVDAAQLHYAHPDDVGEVAEAGRAWVHRACWRAWPMRDAWARSAARLLAPGSWRSYVTTRRTDTELRIIDTLAPFEWPIPIAQLVDVCDALRARGVRHLDVNGVSVTLQPIEASTRVTTSIDGTPIDDLEIEDLDAWIDLSQRETYWLTADIRDEVAMLVAEYDRGDSTRLGLLAALGDLAKRFEVQDIGTDTPPIIIRAEGPLPDVTDHLAISKLQAWFRTRG